MAENKNNFTKPVNKDAATYKMMIKYAPEHASKYPVNPMYYYGHRHLSDKGYKKLIALERKKESEALLIIIYKEGQYLETQYKNHAKQ